VGPLRLKPRATCRSRVWEQHAKLSPVAIGSYAVNLVFQHGRLTGTIADEAVDLEAVIPNSHSSAVGRMGASSVAAVWDVASNYEVAAQPASLVAKFESGEVRLSTTIRLRDTRMPILVGADVVGDVLGDRVAVRVAPGREFSQCVFIDGDVGDLAIDLAAAVSPILNPPKRTAPSAVTLSGSKRRGCPRTGRAEACEAIGPDHRASASCRQPRFCSSCRCAWIHLRRRAHT